MLKNRREIAVIRKLNNYAHSRSVVIPSYRRTVSLNVRSDARNRQTAVVVSCNCNRVNIEISIRLVNR